MFNGTSLSNRPFLILCKCLSFNKSLPFVELLVLLMLQSRLKPSVPHLMCFYYSLSVVTDSLLLFVSFSNSQKQ